MKLDKRLIALINSKAGSGVTEDTVTTMITAAINSLIDSAPDEYNTLGKMAAHLLLTDEQIQTITEQVNDRYTKEETNELVSKIPKFTIEVVTSLPTENISTTTVYLKTGAKSDPDNIYDEYIYVNSKWELLGTQKIDLTNFYTKEETGDLLNNKVDKVSGKGLSTNDYTTAEKNKLAGIAAGANKTVVDSDISTTSTNTIQNKAVGLKFQGVDSEISGINSSLTAKTAEIATIVNAYGSKNLLSLKTTVNKVNANGLNVSFLDDGGIRVYGTKTTTNNGDLYFKPAIKTTLKPNTKYTLTSVNSAPNAMTVRMHLIADEKIIYIGNNKPNVNKTSITFTTPNASNIYVKEYAITVTDNNPIDVTVYPMLRYAAIKDDTYVPYAMTNRELTAKVADTGWVEVEFSENTSFDPSSYLLYRRCGNMVSFRGKLNVTNNDMSLDHTGLALNLPEDVIPRWLLSDGFEDSGAYVAEQPNSETQNLNIWTQVYVNRSGLALVELRSLSGERIPIGHSYTINVTYML